MCVYSMGGHGALICYLKNPGRYASVSAFAPLCHASEPEGVRGKVFPGYLGDDRETWKVRCINCNFPITLSGCTCNLRSKHLKFSLCRSMTRLIY